MRKLFQEVSVESLEDSEVETLERIEGVDEEVNVELLDSLDTSVNATESLFNALEHVTGMMNDLDDKKAPTVVYFTSMEHYTSTMKYIAKNLGVTAKIPAIEDFKSYNGFNACHEVAIEGFMETIKSIWEKIKKFFVDFFKKVMVFLKRLVNAELDIESYEKYMDAMIPQLKQQKEGIDIVELHSRLPELLGDESVDKIDQDYIITTGTRKIKHLTEVINTIEEGSLPLINKVINVIKKELNDFLNNPPQELNAYETFEMKLTKLREEMTETVFNYSAIANDIPESLSDRLISSNILKGNIKVKALLDTNAARTLMPKQYNAFLVISDNGDKGIEYFMGGGKNETISISPVINAIKTPINVVTLYSDYKELRKKTNVASITKQFKITEDLISDLINIVSKKMGQRISEFRQAAINIEKDLVSNPEKSELKYMLDGITKMAGILENVQKSLSNLLNLLQILIKELVTNILAISKEIQFALLKYCYDSGRVILRTNM